MTTKIKLILFDLDGVIIDSSNLWWELFNRLRKQNKLSLMDKQKYLRTIWGTPMITEKQYFPNLSMNDIKEYYEAEFNKNMDKIYKNPDFEMIIKALSQIKKGIISNTPQKQAENILKSLNLYSNFEIVVGERNNLKPKPSPDMINFAISKFDFKVNEVIFVGDTETDMQAGKNAGVLTIGLGVKGGTYSITSLKEIPMLIEGLA